MKRVQSPSDAEPETYLLLRVDPATGDPLDYDGERAKGPPQHYLSFESEALARAHVAAELTTEPLAEWLLVDSAGDHLETIRDRAALAAHAAALEAQRANRVTWWRRLFRI